MSEKLSESKLDKYEEGFCIDGKTTGSLLSKYEMQGQMISEKLSLDKYEVAWLLNALIYNLMY